MVVVSTKKISTDNKNIFERENIDLIEENFISIEYLKSKSLSNEIKKINFAKTPLVFTSQHAVIAFSKISSTKQFSCYCIEGKTKQTIQTYFPLATIIDEGENANQVAEKIIIRNEKEVIFFCGEMRLSTIPEKLFHKNILCREIIVYSTKLTPHKIDTNFDAVLFFSPSGVESFFSINQIGFTVACFAIGETTANVLRNKINNKIFVSNIADEKKLVETIVEYFKNKNKIC